MRLRVNKTALSLSTAFLMVSSIVSVATSAAATNEIILTADKTTARAGDKINVTVGYSPDVDGAAGITLTLHYDPAKVEVYVPTDEELETDFNPNGEFSVITNYAASEDTIKIVGADLSGENVTEDTVLALAEFTVKDGAEGDIGYWVDVETMVTANDDGFESAEYTAPTKNAPYTVDIEKTVTTAVTTAETTTTTKKETTTTTTMTTTTATTTTSAAETEPAETTTAFSETTAAASEIYTQPVDEEYYGEPLFSYVQGTEDFESEEALQYEFRLSDYITDYSVNYDVKVHFNTTGNVSGAVGMLVNGEWDSQYYESFGVDGDTWSYDNLNPNESSDLIYMQIYYLKANAELEITSVEITPVGTYGYEEPVYTTAVMTETVAETEAAPETTTSEIYTETETSAAEEVYTSSVTEQEIIQTAPVETETVGEGQTSEEAVSSEISDEITDDVSYEVTEENEVGEVSTAPADTAAENSSDDSESSSAVTSAEAQEIISAVDSAAQTADKTSASNENPNTGAVVGGKVMDVLTFASIAIIVYSLFAIIYNKTQDSK